MNAQPALGLQLPPEPDLARFVAGPNGEILAALEALAGGDGEPYLYLWGAPGSGRTHLLLGSCRRAGQLGRDSLYLDLAEHPRLAPTLLQGLEHRHLVALDNLHAVAGRGPWELALFDLFNRLREHGRHLLAAGDVPAAELPVTLPDLRSRLTWGPGFRLRPLDDEARLELLQRSAAARGLVLANSDARYILTRHCRDLHALERLLDRLDRLCLEEKKRPGPALVRRAVEEQARNREA